MQKKLRDYTSTRVEDFRTVDDFDPATLLNHLIRTMRLGSDVELAQALEVKPILLSDIRQRKRGVGPAFLIRINDTTGIAIEELRAVMKDRRRRTRTSPLEGKHRGPRIRTTWDRLALQRKK